ncbi:unnamed protein product, partial [marine sediment metagenome]
GALGFTSASYVTASVIWALSATGGVIVGGGFRRGFPGPWDRLPGKGGILGGGQPC